MPHPTPEIESALEVFDRLKPELSELSETPSNLIRVSPARVWEQAQELVQRLEPLLPEAEAAYSPTRFEDVKSALTKLVEYALCYYATDLQLVRSNQRRKSSELVTLEASLREDDKLLTHWARTVFGKDPNETELLQKINKGQGAEDVSEDVMSLSGLFLRRWHDLLRTSWPAVLHEHGLNLEVFHRMAKDATHWLHLSRFKKVSKSEMEKLRQQAYTGVLQHYLTLWRAGRDLRWEETWLKICPTPRPRTPKARD